MNPDDGLDATSVLVVVCSMFVFMMTMPGLALFYGSLVSQKNLVDTMLQSVVLTGTIPICWWLATYSLCFDTSASPVIGGLHRSLLSFSPADENNGIPEGAWCLWQLTFAIITPAIASGAVVERTLFWPLMLVATMWHVVVYCPICYMVWGGGVLMQWGVLDTAGGLVVETSSGVSALMLCYVVGPRLKGANDPEESSTVQSRAFLHIVGAALLWVGWLGFNAASVISSSGRVATTALNTLLAGSAGSLAWFFTARLSTRHEGMTNLDATFHLLGGAIAGLVAATPSSGFVGPSGSLFIGASAGVLCRLADSQSFTSILHARGIDDAVSAFAVHGVAGIWGTIMTGVCAVDEMGGTCGLSCGNWRPMAVQLAAVLIVCTWSALGTAVCAWPLGRAGCLRATSSEEVLGMDHRCHGESPTATEVFEESQGATSPLRLSQRRTSSLPQFFNGRESESYTSLLSPHGKPDGQPKQSPRSEERDDEGSESQDSSGSSVECNV